MNSLHVIVMGGGPAGATAALTLKKLGHNVTILEKSPFPRYRIGESLLPGTMSIFKRLGIWEKIEEYNFVKKPSATFLWGQNQRPYTFTFATAKPTEWVFDHAIQVERSKFDQLLINEAVAAGVNFIQEAKVIDVDVSSPDEVILRYMKDGEEAVISSDYLVDASGTSSPLVKKLGIRRYDEFYRSIAVWSYFKLDDPFKGDLAGTTYSITFEDGWVWMIPIEKGTYSIGMIIDYEKTDNIKEQGLDTFYKNTLKKCDRAMELIGEAPMIDKVRATQDWAYDTLFFSKDRYFLVGDSACFTDPLFSQGVHLAVRGAVEAASAIDAISKNPEKADSYHAWYDRSYRDAYEHYHEFVASYYTYASFTEKDSYFWRRRGVKELNDERLERRTWFTKILEKSETGKELAIEDFRDRSSTMVAIGRHKRDSLSDDYCDSELNSEQILWISKLHKQLNKIEKFEWHGDQVTLNEYYKVHPTKFVLEEKSIIGNGNGKDMKKYQLTEENRSYIEKIRNTSIGFSDLNQHLINTGHGEFGSKIIIQLIENGLMSGYDREGKKVHIQDRLRFDGVGSEYEV
jgi:flavin-dependent dehydrogenase